MLCRIQLSVDCRTQALLVSADVNGRKWKNKREERLFTGEGELMRKQALGFGFLLFYNLRLFTSHFE